MQFENPNLPYLVLLFLHIGGAVVAFGPTFVMPLIGAAGGREPQHAGFATRLAETIAQRRITPVSIWVAVTGILLIVASGRSPGELWLSAAILLYVIALVFSLFVTAPTAAKLVEATNAPRPAPAADDPPRAGPPPHIAELVAKSRRNGMVLALLVTAILFLLVFKPQLG